MMNHLKALLLSCFGRQPARRTGGLPHFRGQFEQLESRTVLSATTGAEPVDLEALAGAVWANEAASTAWRPHFREHALVAAYGLASNAYAADGHFEDRVNFDRPDRADVLPGLFNSVQNRPGYVVAIITIHISPNGWPTGEFLPPKPPLETTSPTIPKPLAATSPNGSTGEEPAWQPPLMARAPDAPYVAPASGLVMPAAAVDSANDSTAPLAGARDTVFQGYSSQSLLLAASVDASRDRDDERLDDEIRSSLNLDEEDEENSARDGADADEDVATPFDELGRELEAIDRVLTELHEVEICDQEPQGESRRTGVPAETTLPTPGEELRWGDAQRAQLLPVAPAEGGMVLLEPGGDANLSTQDLTTFFARGLEHSANRTLGLEVSVGIYQAQDIGSSEPPSAKAADTAVASPVAAPAATAEVAPAKQSVRSS